MFGIDIAILLLVGAIAEAVPWWAWPLIGVGGFTALGVALSRGEGRS